MPDSAFFSLTPVVSLMYFVLLGAVTAMAVHPAAAAANLVCACILYVYLLGKNAFFKTLSFALPFAILMAVLNPVFSHRGVTMLAYLPDGNPLTLESMVYGAVSGVRLLSSLLLFGAVCRVMTAERIIYLLGRILPSCAVLFSSALAFVPQMMQTAKEINTAVTVSGEKRGIKRGLREFSMLVTAMLERGADSAESMRARGWGTGLRTAYSEYALKRRDCLPMAALVLAAAVIWMLRDSFYAVFYPAISVSDFGVASAAALMLAGLLPIIYDMLRSLQWKLSR